MTTPLRDRLPPLHLQRYLIAGVLTLLPLWLTYIVFKVIFGLLSGVTVPWITAIAQPLAEAFPVAFGWLESRFVQSLIALFFTLLLVYAVGWAANRVVGRRLIEWLEALIARVPMAQAIYGGTKKLLELMQTKPDATQRVVLIDFPHSNMKAVGLVTRVLRDETSGRDFAAVYVPTTPNPTSGYLELVPVDSVTPTDWTMEQAMAFIISGGAISPQTLRMGPAPPASPTPDRPA